MRGQVDADHQRELRDGVAQHVAGQRAGQQLVDQPAGGQDQHVQEEHRRAVHRLSADGGGDDDRDADDRRADNQPQRDVLVLLDLLADRERANPHQNEKEHDAQRQPQEAEDDRIRQVDAREVASPLFSSSVTGVPEMRRPALRPAGRAAGVGRLDPPRRVAELPAGKLADA